jgi:rhamnogalacturonyl hydrolase YesR
MLNTKAKKDPVGLAADWLLNSGIQSEEGGFYSWYNLKDKSYAYLYSEITGYAITALVFLSKINRDSIFIKKAESAADWILRYAIHPCGGVKTRLYKNDDKADASYSFSGENIFSFDTGMVLYGMASLYNATGKEKFLGIAERLALFIIDKMQNKDGSLSAVYNAKTDELINTYDKWSNQAAGFHAKACLGLVELFSITNNKRYSESAIRLCEYAFITQEGSGRFITDKAANTTHLHPHCYTAEGLLYTGALLNMPKFVKAAKKAAEWAFSCLSSDGINELYNPSDGSFNNLQRSDILAQVLRLGLLFSLNARTNDLMGVLSKYQYNGEDIEQRGGFLFSANEQHVNCWCTMFAVQALALYYDKGLIENNIIEPFI